MKLQKLKTALYMLPVFMAYPALAEIKALTFLNNVKDILGAAKDILPLFAAVAGMAMVIGGGFYLKAALKKEDRDAKPWIGIALMIVGGVVAAISSVMLFSAEIAAVDDDSAFDEA